MDAWLEHIKENRLDRKDIIYVGAILGDFP